MPSLSQPENHALTPVRIRCYHFDRDFQFAFHSPQTRRHRADSVIVRIDCNDGTIGFGESAPRTYVTGETALSVATLITERFAPILFAHPIASMKTIESVLPRLDAVCQQNAISARSSAIGAIDLALLDALERSRRLPFNQLFPTIHRDVLRFAVSVPVLPLDVIEQYFPRLKGHLDIAVLKILVSEDIQETYRRAELLGRLAQADTELRLEFNGKMTTSRVRKYLAKLTPLSIHTVEEPLPAEDLNKLPSLRDEFELDFVADESLVSIDDASRLVESGAYSVFNIKVSKCGGLLQSRQIAQLADKYGIQCHVGTHVGESELLGIAGRRLARSLPNFDCYGGGSEVLFSRILASPQQAPQVLWSPTADQSPISLETCLNLISQCRLLADTHSQHGG